MPLISFIFAFFFSACRLVQAAAALINRFNHAFIIMHKFRFLPRAVNAPPFESASSRQNLSSVILASVFALLSAASRTLSTTC